MILVGWALSISWAPPMSPSSSSFWMIPVRSISCCVPNCIPPTHGLNHITFRFFSTASPAGSCLARGTEKTVFASRLHVAEASLPIMDFFNLYIFLSEVAIVVAIRGNGMQSTHHAAGVIGQLLAPLMPRFFGDVSFGQRWSICELGHLTYSHRKYPGMLLRSLESTDVKFRG